jgi:hypothetical protein
MAMTFVMVFGTVPVFVNAAEDQVLVPIETTSMTVGVYFADNMVFAPQWRTGNIVRIEMMVIDLGSQEPKDVLATEINMYDQATLLATPAKVLDTRMVSVQSIKVDIVPQGGTLEDAVWSEVVSWDPVTMLPLATSDCFGREINKAGHLIYGGQWDTTGVAEGVYTVWVTLGSYYTISYAMGSNKTDEVNIFDTLADDETDDVYVLYDLGIGSVANGQAWLDLGKLIGRGAGGGSGNGGGGNGNGGKK